MRALQLLVVSIPLLWRTPLCLSQPTPPDPVLPTAPLPPPPHKRILGIIPNYRTYPTTKDYRPISARDKFKIGVQDSFDRGSVILAALFAAKAYGDNSNPSFGHGAAGISKNFGAAYADIVIGNFMTDSIYPTLLHQDPRFFRRDTGSGLSRAGYALSQLFWVRTDSGGHAFNYSEVAGNATAAAIANAYYPDNRTAGAAVSRLAIQLGIDAAGNLLKEFWPDLDRKLSRKHRNPKP